MYKYSTALTKDRGGCPACRLSPASMATVRRATLALTDAVYQRASTKTKERKYEMHNCKLGGLLDPIRKLKLKKEGGKLEPRQQH
jgi:hypothetical protein